MHTASIREMDPDRDAEAIVGLLRESMPSNVYSVEGWRHRIRTIPERALHRAWVAERDGAVIGNGYAFRDFFSEAQSTAVCGLVVAAAHRRQGTGTALWELVAAHAADLEPPQTTTTFHENDAGVAFARQHGFHEVRAETASVLDPSTVDEHVPDGLDVRAVSQVDSRLVYEVDMAATLDMPSLEPPDDMPYDEWEEHVLDHPLFSADGSFVVMADGVAAAVSLLLVDEAKARALNMFTGTLPGYRGRGYALAVKLASIAWAAEQGIREMVTTNDETNAPMLAINKRLGYAPAGRRVEYLRDSS